MESKVLCGQVNFSSRERNISWTICGPSFLFYSSALDKLVDVLVCALDGGLIGPKTDSPWSEVETVWKTLGIKVCIKVEMQVMCGVKAGIKVGLQVTFGMKVIMQVTFGMNVRIRLERGEGYNEVECWA